MSFWSKKEVLASRRLKEKVYKSCRVKEIDVLMTNEEMDELQKEAERLEDEFAAMGKMFEETGFFTQEDKELVEYLSREYRTRHELVEPVEKKISI